MTRNTLTRILLLLLALAAVAAPIGSSASKQVLRSSLDLELNIYDAYLSQVCDTNVTADLSGLLERKVVVGKTSSETIWFHGKITWYAENRTKSYSSALVNKQQIDYPEGIELFAPAHVTVSGRHGGTFPIGGGPPGQSTLEYDAVIYAEHEGFPYIFTVGDPVVRNPDKVDRATAEICAALT